MRPHAFLDDLHIERRQLLSQVPAAMVCDVAAGHPEEAHGLVAVYAGEQGLVSERTVSDLQLPELRAPLEHVLHGEIRVCRKCHRERLHTLAILPNVLERLVGEESRDSQAPQLPAVPDNGAEALVHGLPGDVVRQVWRHDAEAEPGHVRALVRHELDGLVGHPVAKVEDGFQVGTAVSDGGQPHVRDTMLPAVLLQRVDSQLPQVGAGASHCLEALVAHEVEALHAQGGTQRH